MRTITEIDDHGVALSKPRVKFQKAVDSYRRMSARLNVMDIKDEQRSRYAHIMMKKKILALKLAGGDAAFEEDTPAQKIERYHYRYGTLIRELPAVGRPRIEYKDTEDVPANDKIWKSPARTMPLPRPYEGELIGGLDYRESGFPIAGGKPQEKFQHESAA